MSKRARPAETAVETQAKKAKTEPQAQVQIASLDADEQSSASKAGAEADAGIQWLVVEPAEMADWELVQEDIRAGVKCNKLDILRLNSRFLKAAMDALDEGERRIPIPNKLFPDAKEMHELFHRILGMGSVVYNIQTKELERRVHQCDALDLLSGEQGKYWLGRLVTHASKLPAATQLDIARRYHKPELVPAAARALAVEWNESPGMDVSDAVLRQCAPHWTASVTTVEAARVALTPYLQSRLQRPACSGFHIANYRGDIGPAFNNVIHTLGLDLMGELVKRQ